MRLMPFKFSFEPPIVSRDIMLRNLADLLVLVEVKEIILALAGDRPNSSGGPSSKNSMSSLAACDICGFLNPVGLPRPFVCGNGPGGISSSSSPSDPLITASRSIDSLFRCMRRVRGGPPFIIPLILLLAETDLCIFDGSGGGRGGGVSAFFLGAFSEMAETDTERTRKLAAVAADELDCPRLICRVRGAGG